MCVFPVRAVRVFSLEKFVECRNQKVREETELFNACVRLCVREHQLCLLPLSELPDSDSELLEETVRPAEDNHIFKTTVLGESFHFWE